MSELMGYTVAVIYETEEEKKAALSFEKTLEKATDFARKAIEYGLQEAKNGEMTVQIKKVAF